MSYSLLTLWHERSRFLPGILAVGFSALLIALQCGLLLGLFSLMSTPIDHARAEVWVGTPEVSSVDLGRAIPEAWFVRLARDPAVVRVEPYLVAFASWTKPRSGGVELCMILGSRLDPQSLAAVAELTPELRARLEEPGTVVVDRSDLEQLGLQHGIGEEAEINGHHVRVVGLIDGLRALSGPYIFCSQETARPLIRGLAPDETIYLVARCRQPADAPAAVERLRRRYGGQMTVMTRDEFSLSSRLHWLLKTRAGVALGCAAVLGLLVGAAVTSQTLYAATAASLPQYAVLRALGIPRRRIALTVLAQAFWVGVIGVVLSVPATYLLAETARLLGTPVRLPAALLALAAGLTLIMAVLSGLSALRLVWRVEPAVPLR
jgi:putative ABC transport system permease protein